MHDGSSPPPPNILVVQLSEDSKIKKNKLAAAFGITDARLRQLRKIAREQGKEALPSRGPGGTGRPAKVTPALRRCQAPRVWDHLRATI